MPDTVLKALTALVDEALQKADALDLIDVGISLDQARLQLADIVASYASAGGKPTPSS